MPVYNMLCPKCGMDKEEFVPYDTFITHNSSELPVECPCCKEHTAFYSLTHLKENLKWRSDNVLNYYAPGEQEKWFRGFEDLGRR